MRTTIDIPEDLHRIASSLARHTGRSLAQIVAELMRRGLETPAVGVTEAASTPYRQHPLTGLPVVHSRRPITDDDVKTLEDEKG